ncbi:PhoX family protein [Rivularia sp. UHCC 0363]|uniref:PhoX family protein n=1 Tax=Rivularia sp. UHCC 0363 TaxID=3110244 RepID=UPI002B1FA9BB|nr:alkaline phosphatase PhoX [Rivularia sp. UHCC 0363]MEA5593644.1 alkaline phosphatase PhoX [Rivularia sp. UHCC 0363]
MSIKRRDFLLLMGASAGAVALNSLSGCDRKVTVQPNGSQAKALSVFKPVKGPIPLQTAGFNPEQQQEAYRNFEVVDDLVLPDGFEYQVIAAWGDKVGDSRFGYNNDYLSFVPTGENEGYLSVNFEYISATPWMQTYAQVIGKPLPFDEVIAKLKTDSQGKSEINAYALREDDPLKANIREICSEALLDQGLGVISIRKNADGKWERTNSNTDRRISGISGLEDGRYLKSTGPAVVVFRKQKGLGYTDKLGDRIIGSFANCAGGTTPWGTVLSAEENFQAQVPEPVYADGTSFEPDKVAFSIAEGDLYGQGNVFGLAGNKYGWIVEVDPANPNDYGTKHTWLGRYHHEAVGVRVETGKPLAFYSGCDRRGGHVYKFVSSAKVSDPKDKANSQLLSKGMLYAAKFDANGTGRWIPLNADTSVNPDLPSNIAGKLLPLPLGSQSSGRQTLFEVPKPIEGNYLAASKDEEVAKYKQQFKKLGDLYVGNAEEKQGAILIDAHYAANAAGATCTARPEDTEIAPNGDLYISFTSGSPGDDGGPDSRVFKGPKGEVSYEYGWVMRLTEDSNDPAANTFKWEMLATGGELASGGMGFANPDNLLLDKGGNVWMVTDVSTSKLNNAVKNRTDDKGKTANISGLFGNNTIWYIPTSGENAGQAFLFGIGPMECETTGPCFTPDEQTMFLSIQHPGEANGTRLKGASENRDYLVYSTTGEEFAQTRQVPIGSNWPDKSPDAPPKPAVIYVTKT